MSARDFALAQLDSIALPNWRPHALRRRVGAPEALRDLALAEQLRLGVIKNLLLLQALILHHSGRALEKIDPGVQKILAVALYQLRFLDRIPPRAAVDEAVEQARRFGRGSAAGFVNAVLRNALRNSDPPDLPPHTRWSHPPELLSRIAAIASSPDEIERFCRHNNAVPPTIVRLCRGANPAQLAADGISITPHSAGADLFVVEPARLPILADWSRRGIAQVQDPTSAAVVPLMALETGMTVLDRCCGVGTKTLQIRELIGDGRVIAIDPNAERCNLLRRTLAGRGIDNVGVIEASWLADAAAVTPKEFDRVLVDAPCSNSGVLARRAEARYRQDDATLASLAQLQDKILDDTAAAVRSGGLLVYSTCSIWPEENEARILRFLAKHRKYRLLTEVRQLPESKSGPTSYRDGGYVAILSKSSASSI